MSREAIVPGPDLIVPDWPAPPGVRALVTTRALGDMRAEEGRAKKRVLVPAAPAWYRQEHGTRVVEGSDPATIAADASFTRTRGVVCAVMVADCLPVLLAAADGSAVAVAHAGWRGLAAGVIEALIDRMRFPGDRMMAWLGPAIGPGAYEVGDEVRAAYLEKGDPETAFSATRPGHWRLDLYAVARRRLAARGVTRVYGGTFCTFSDSRFYSYRRDQTAQRMAALVWLA